MADSEQNKLIQEKFEQLGEAYQDVKKKLEGRYTWRVFSSCSGNDSDLDDHTSLLQSGPPPTAMTTSLSPLQNQHPSQQTISKQTRRGKGGRGKVKGHRPKLDE